MNLLRFLALFFANFARRHRKPPTAGNPPPPAPTEEELFQAYIENCFAQIEELFRQWKAGTLPQQQIKAHRAATKAKSREAKTQTPRATKPPRAPRPRHPARPSRHKPQNPIPARQPARAGP